MVKVIFVHTMLLRQSGKSRARAMSTVIFSDGDAFNVLLAEEENGAIVARTGIAIIDRDMREMAREAVLTDYSERLNANKA